MSSLLKSTLVDPKSIPILIHLVSSLLDISMNTIMLIRYMSAFGTSELHSSPTAFASQTGNGFGLSGEFSTRYGSITRYILTLMT
jgi:hypothetical protein